MLGGEAICDARVNALGFLQSLARPAARPCAAGGNASTPTGQSQLLVQAQASPFGLTVLRVDTANDGPSRATFDSSGQRLIFKDQYIEWSTKVDPNSFLYGAGERASETTYITVCRG